MGYVSCGLQAMTCSEPPSHGSDGDHRPHNARGAQRAALLERTPLRGQQRRALARTRCSAATDRRRAVSPARAAGME